MLDLMQNLALCHLWKELGGKKPIPINLREWFIREKLNDPGQFFSFLVEPAGKIEKYYALSQDSENENCAILESADIGSIKGNSAIILPFNKPSGPKSPQIGPVIKRSYSRQKGAGPVLTTINSTLKRFKTISESNTKWANYFEEAFRVFDCNTVIYSEKIYDCKYNSFHTAIEIIPETKPVFLILKTAEGKLPGEVPEYTQYLSSMLDADVKYAIAKAKPVQTDECPCCGKKKVKVYPAGLSKAGLNIFNIDREGAFPNITNKNAHLSYSICEDCADLLYIYKFHVNENFITSLAGQESLMIPELYITPSLLNKFLDSYQSYLDYLTECPEKAILVEKKKLVKLLKNEKAICSIDIIWSNESLKGQDIKKISGRITDVLPSRLRHIEEFNSAFLKQVSPIFPKHRLDEFVFDLNFSFLEMLFKRPGGKKANKINKSRKLIELKRHLVETIYKKKIMPEKRLWEEIIITANWYIVSLFEKAKPEIDCLYEGFDKKKNKPNLASWVKYLAMTLSYLNFMEVMKSMENQRTYFPEMEKLQKYFSDDCGINSNEKAFAFILGVLFGRVMQIQGAKGVNVNANALTWLKRLTLSGKDLPELYVKIREKLLAYDAEKSEILRAIIKEAGQLGNILGDNIILSQIPCCYFLLLGQSISVDLFPTKKDKSKKS
jgi:CRISPR-associated protein Csh1